jgi:broad specificity phosphatase PhoE
MKLNDVLFFVVRHGETAGNQKKTYRGWSNGPDAQLDKSGRRDADEAGEYLASIGVPVALIITDSLDRTQETAELIAAYFPAAKIQAVRALHPLNVGDWTDKPKDEHPVEPYLKDPEKRIPGGDTVGAFNKGQLAIFTSIFQLVDEFPAGKIVVVVHGSNVAYLFNHVFNKGEDHVGYEGLVDPGGVIAATPGGLVPLTKVRVKQGDRKKDDPVSVSELVALEPWALGYVTEEQIGDEPASCLTCHMMLARQKRCMILGPDIAIDVLDLDGKRYTPVCGELYDHGEPVGIPDDEVMYPAAVNGAEKADQIGLEWAEGDGTNCGGKNGGARCVKHYVAKDKKEGFCRPLQKEVYAGDCCSAHNGPALVWREAQQYLKGNM